MEKEGLIRFEGATRNRRYFARAQRAEEPSSPVPLSPESIAALGLVAGPVAGRPPVGYVRAFLDEYEPGATWYLPAETRARLAALGKTPEEHQPAGTYVRHVLERFLLDLSWNSSRLEGNTYSLLDTERLLKSGAEAEGKPLVETQMLLNHKAAIEFLVAEPMVAAIDERTLKAIHALLLENLVADPLDEGRLRSTPVQISSSTYVPLANPQVIDDCFRQLVRTAVAIADPFETSLFLLAHLPYLQPFIDGNKRTARLAANLPFIIENLVPLSFADVPGDLLMKSYLVLYEHRRIEPLRDLLSWAYERSAARLGLVRSSLGEPDPLRLRYRAQLRALIADVVRSQVPAGRLGSKLEGFAREHIAVEDQRAFINAARAEVHGLHDGNFARYGLRPSEFEAWKQT